MKTLEYKTDTDIRRDVLEEIERDWRFKPAELGVEVDDGVVTLRGTVSSYPKLLAAAELAADVAGVKGVANELTVRPTGTTVIDDTELVNAVRTTLKWHPEIPDERIEVIVRNGVVSLRGTVDHWYQRKAAGDAAGRIGGVTFVNNHIVASPRSVEDVTIEQDLRRSLRRRLPLDADDIKVVADKGEVTLTGRVRLYAYLLQAEKAAWMTDGVRNVSNKLITTW